jgi:hypothetical protein
MKPRVRMVQNNMVQVILPTPTKIPDERKVYDVKAWKDSFLSLSTESLVCMFASECGALIDEVEVSACYCTFKFKFFGKNGANYFCYLMRNL